MRRHERRFELGWLLYLAAVWTELCSETVACYLWSSRAPSRAMTSARVRRRKSIRLLGLAVGRLLLARRGAWRMPPNPRIIGTHASCGQERVEIKAAGTAASTGSGAAASGAEAVSALSSVALTALGT